MKTLEEFKADAKAYEEVTTNASVRKYRAFMNYMSRFIYVMFKDVEQEIISWLNNDNDKRLIISVCTGGIHSISIAIGLDDRSHIDIMWFGAHDQYYDPKISFNSTDESIREFFSHEYSKFLRYYVPCGQTSGDNVVIEFVDNFNDAFYDKFKSMFMSIGLKDFSDFKKSKYTLSFSDEKVSEMGNQIYSYYETFTKIAQDCSCAIDAAKKDVMC